MMEHWDWEELGCKSEHSEFRGNWMWITGPGSSKAEDFNPYSTPPGTQESLLLLRQAHSKLQPYQKPFLLLTLCTSWLAGDTLSLFTTLQPKKILILSDLELFIPGPLYQTVFPVGVTDSRSDLYPEFGSMTTFQKDSFQNRQYSLDPNQRV